MIDTCEIVLLAPPTVRHDHRRAAMDLTRTQFIRLCAGTLAAASLPACGSNNDKPPGTPPIDSPVADAPQAVDAAIDARPPIDAPPDAPAPLPNCQQNGTKSTIGSNHGHAMVIEVSKEDVIAGVAKSYTIDGGGHPHTIGITAPMFALLKNNMPVTATSTDFGGHVHDVTIACV